MHEGKYIDKLVTFETWENSFLQTCSFATLSEKSLPLQHQL